MENLNTKHIQRYYNLSYRKKLISKIEKLKNKDDYINIYKIIVDDIGTNYCANSNGIFININILSDNCIAEINNYISDKSKNFIEIYPEKFNFNKIYNNDKIDNISNFVKLSNQEKNLIKKISSNYSI
jgi:hypothetical protein